MQVNPIGPGGPEELAPDFPRGKDAEILWKVREAFRECSKDQGYEVTGCGIGCGGENSAGEADIGLEVDGRRVEVRIYLPKPIS